MGASLYDQHLAAQPDTSGPSLYDQHLAAQADTSGPSLYDQHLASQAPLGDTVAANILKDNPGAAQIARTQTPAPTTIDYNKPIPGSAPSLWERLKATGRSMLPQAGETPLQAVGRDAVGLAKGAVQPFTTLGKAGAYGLADLAHATGVRSPQDTTQTVADNALPFNRPSTRETLEAVPQVAAAVLAPELPIGKLASPLARFAARTATGAGIGAIYQPNDPLQGAVIGGALGGLHGAVSEGTANLSLDPLKKSLGGLVDPETAAQAAQVPALTAERDIANARAVASQQGLEALNTRVHPREDPLIAQGPAPTRAFAEWANLTPQEQAHYGSRDAYVAASSGQVAPVSAGVQIPTHEADAVPGTPAPRITEPHPQVDGPSNGPLPAGGLATPETAKPAPVGTVDPIAQPALHDQQQLEYRNTLVTAPGALDATKNALDRPYAKLENPTDLPVRNQLLAAGAGRGHGMYVAQRGGAYITHGLAPADVANIGRQITADQIKGYADGYRASGDTEAANTAEQHMALALQGVPANIKSTAAYQTYIDRWNETYGPHYNETSTKTGVPEENFRAVQPNSVYSPLLSDALREQPRVLRASARGNRTGLSSAAEIATGLGSYSLDPIEAAQRFMPERTAKAAQNDLWQSVRSRGRELTSADPSALLEGERMVVFDDKNQLTAPTAENARHYVAVPEHVNEALQQYLDRRDAPKGEGKINRALTSAAMIGSPAVGITHGGSIAQTVNSVSVGGLGDIPRTAAAAIPFGNTLAGIADMNRIDMNDPATVQRQFALSKYGGLRPLDAAKPLSDNPILRAGQKLGRLAHKDLFGLNGMDERGRAVTGQRLMNQDPEAHPADVAQQMGQMFGQYNRLNQPSFVYEGQKRGLTSFAPAGVGFTTDAVKRMTGQRGALPFIKSTAAPIAGAAALTYALSGHSPMQNDAGHRGDIDLGYTGGPNNTEQYLRSSYAYPLLNRAANTIGLRPLLEGQGISGAVGGAANEALAQAGVIPRAMFGLANATLREANGYNGLEQAVKPQFGESNRFLKIAQGAGAPFLGAAGGVGGFNAYDANQSPKDRMLNAIHANAVASGKVGGTEDDDVRYAGMQDKITAAKAEVYKVQGDTAKTAATIANILARARSDGYSQDALDLIEGQLQKAAEMSPQDRAERRQGAMQKKGLGTP